MCIFFKASYTSGVRKRNKCATLAADGQDGKMIVRSKFVCK